MGMGGESSGVGGRVRKVMRIGEGWGKYWGWEGLGNGKFEEWGIESSRE